MFRIKSSSLKGLTILSVAAALLIQTPVLATNDNNEQETNKSVIVEQTSNVMQPNLPNTGSLHHELPQTGFFGSSATLFGSALGALGAGAGIGKYYFAVKKKDV